MGSFLEWKCEKAIYYFILDIVYIIKYCVMRSLLEKKRFICVHKLIFSSSYKTSDVEIVETDLFE